MGLGLFFPCLPGGIHLTSVRLLLFMKRRSSRLENLKNVDEFWLHSFLRDPFFSILFHSNKKKERFYGLAAHLMYFRCLWHPVISTPELRAALKNPQIKATLCYQYDEWNIRHLPIWLYYHPECSFLGRACDMAHGMVHHFGPGLNMSTTWNVLQTLTVSRGWILIILMKCWVFSCCVTM